MGIVRAQPRGRPCGWPSGRTVDCIGVEDARRIRGQRVPVNPAIEARAVAGVAGSSANLFDLVDHRGYNSSDYHFWSFLAEDEDWSDNLVNRLRSCEIRSHMERAGFEILHYENRIGNMPAGFMKQVAGRFREMTEEELSTTGVFCVLKKP